MIVAAVAAVDEETAASLGVNVRRSERLVYAASSLLVGVTVAVGGTIGFVGLIVPHLLRLRLGLGNTARGDLSFDDGRKRVHVGIHSNQLLLDLRGGGTQFAHPGRTVRRQRLRHPATRDGAGVADQVAVYRSGAHVHPDYVDFARWDGVATVSDPAIPAAYWSPTDPTGEIVYTADAYRMFINEIIYTLTH